MSMQLWAGRALALVGVLAALTARAQAEEQSEVGVGVGGFFDVRTESKIGPSDTTFTYSGARLAARGEKWGEAYVDLGWETLDLDRYDSGGGLAVGVGGTLWCWKWEAPVAPLALGIAGDYRTAEHSMEAAGDSEQTDVRHTSVSVQAVIQARLGSLSPYLRAGCLQSRLEPDAAGFFGDSGTRDTVPAIQGGFEYEFNDQVDRFTIGVEASYFSGPGATVRLAYWF